jgi:hypothetical protein
MIGEKYILVTTDKKLPFWPAHICGLTSPPYLFLPLLVLLTVPKSLSSFYLCDFT